MSDLFIHGATNLKQLCCADNDTITTKTARCVRSSTSTHLIIRVSYE